MSIHLDILVNNKLLTCIYYRLKFINKKINSLLKLRLKVIAGEIDDFNLIYSCNKKINHFKEEYSLLLSLRNKILCGEILLRLKKKKNKRSK